MVGERGPAGKRHVPEYRSGCYRKRIVECCWLCMGRLLATQTLGSAEYSIKRTAEEHDLIGTEVVLPTLPVAEDEPPEHRTGEVVEVYELTDHPTLFGIRLETGEKLVLSRSPDT